MQQSFKFTLCQGSNAWFEVWGGGAVEVASGGRVGGYLYFYF